MLTPGGSRLPRWRSQAWRTGRSTSLLVGVALLGIGWSTPASAQTDSTEFKLSADVRVRSEMDARTSGAASDHATLLRSRVAVTARRGNLIALVQISDSRAFGEETNTLTDATADRLDVPQAYLAWTPRDEFRLAVGRQELAFADERLVGAVQWTNVNRSFDGARLTLLHEDWEIDAFAAVLDERAALMATGLDPRINGDSAGDRSLFGAWAANANVDLFALADRNATNGASRTDIDRFTLGARGREQLGPLAVEATAAAQFGHQTQGASSRQEIRAYMVTAAGTYGFRGPLGGRLGLQVDYLSGDDTPLDGTFRGFNTLYATNHKFYGFMDMFLNMRAHVADLGLVDGIVRGVIRPLGWTVRGDLHRFWLARSSPAEERELGYELDLTASGTLDHGLGVQAGYSLFVPSSAGESAPIGLGDEVLHWAYVQLLARF
jgi:hypothetical protein